MVNFIEITVSDDEDGRRFDRFLRNYFADLSQADIEKLLRSKMVRLDGQKAMADTRIHAGSIIRYPDFLSVAEKEYTGNKPVIAFPQELILYQDNDLMVINKPHGLAVQGGSNTKIHLDMMLETLPKRNGYRPSSVHRLDKDTSGCLLIAKKRTVAAQLGEALKNREFEKYYLAITQTIPNPHNGKIENYLAKSNNGNRDIMQVVDSDVANAQLATSVYYTLSHSEKTNKAFVLLTPITGRTHQLRVHCHHIGSPIVGDGKYNDLNVMNTKLCLHAAKLIFQHPATNETMEIDAPIPEYFMKTLSKCQLSLNNPISHANREILQHLLKSKLQR